MVSLKTLNSFIENEILHSEVWDNAPDRVKNKAINNATRNLHRLLPKQYPANTEIPVEDLAEQCIWMLKIDDMVQRTELGAKYINIDGISISYSTKDRSLCPFLMQKFNLSENWNARRKVGRYATFMEDTCRKGW
ncbi:hypothetical protein SCB17_003119 [Clostridium perfringens]|nr:hypothetical protein [Clostridium perfringens]